MLYGYGVLGMVELALLVYCVLDVIRTPEAQVRNLPKLLWLLLVVILPLAGGVAWLFAGRPLPGTTTTMPYKGNRGIPSEYDRPGRAVAQNPDDDEAFLRGLRERAEQQRRAADEQRRREAGGDQP